MGKLNSNTTVSSLRAKFADYTILRMLAKKAGLKDSAVKLMKHYGSAYKAARIILARLQKAMPAKA